MKARDYYEKYHKKIMLDSCEINKIAEEAGSKEAAVEEINKRIRSGMAELLDAMNQEVKELCEKRKCKFDSAVASVIKEMNDKWNALIPLFEQGHGECFLERNGYAKFWIKRLPGLSEYIKI